MPIKQVIIIRNDLNMRRGKSEAQAAHASMKVFFDIGEIKKSTLSESLDIKEDELCIPLDKEMKEWVEGSFKKIVLSCSSEDELKELYRKARFKNLPCCIIQDSGYTEFHGVPTYTCMAIGPASSTVIDTITGNLKLR